jgi:fatty acid desaturase
LHLSAKFPITPSSFRRKVLRDLTGQTAVKQYGALLRSALTKDSVPLAAAGPGTVSGQISGFWQRLGPNLVINLGFLIGFTLAGAWYLYFLLWLLPAFTWERFITRVRNIGEHAVVPDNNDRLRNTRTVLANWWERAFIAPYRVNYHLEHHLLVSCPLYRLPEAHAMLMAQGLGPLMEVQPNYASILRAAVSVPEPVKT